MKPDPRHSGTPALAPSAGNGGRLAPGIPSHALRIAARPGAPLPRPLRHTLERRFGHSLADVRVHDDAAAQGSARRLGAEAYTLGPHIVLGRDRYAPHSTAGHHLLAHELAHVLQQRAGGAARLQRRPDPKAFAALQDPIAVNALPGYGFYTMGPEFTGMPGLADIEKVLAEVGIADAATLAACTTSEYTVTVQGGGGGDLRYTTFRHPSLGVIARAGATLSSFGKGGKSEPRYAVSAYVDADSALKYRPVGGSGELRSPIGLLGEMSEKPVLSYAELLARLQLLEQRLAALTVRYNQTVPALAKALAQASRQTADMKSRLVATPASSRTVQTALQLAEWIDQDLSLLDRYRAQLAAKNTSAARVDALRDQYAGVLDKLFDPSAPGLYDTLQKQAEQLPTHVALDALAKGGRFHFPDGTLLPDAEVIQQWSKDLHGRVEQLYAKRDQGQNVDADSEFLSLSLRGLQLYTQRLAVWVDFFNNRPGITDAPLINAMGRLRDRVHAIKDAYDANNVKLLKQRVASMENDPAINEFYAALPAAMKVTQMIARIGVTTLAAMASGGVGGLLSGGARTAATGLTLRATARFVGTAALEAATFTAVNTTAQAVVFGDKVSLGSVLRDFAWNLGLFTVLRGVSGLTSVGLRAMELQALSMPVNLAVGFPFAHGWGLLRFRVEQNRWPTEEELNRMTAESLLMMAAMAVGTGTVQRWMQAHAKATSLKYIHTEYLWRFDALEKLRSDLGQRVQRAEAAGKGNDPAEVADATAQAEKLETAFRELFERMLRDKKLDIAEMRKELNALREQAPDVAAQLMSDVLGVPAEALVRRAGPASYTYANGKTSPVEDALSATYKVTKRSDPKTGLKTVTAEAPGRPVLTFQERSAALDFDTGVFDVNKLVADLKISSPGAHRMLWRILQEQGMSLDPGRATANARQIIKGLVSKAGKGADADTVLAELHQKGRLGATAKAKVANVADKLQDRGILQSPEWLEARSLDNRRGVVSEWLAKEMLPTSGAQRALRRVTAYGDLYEDAAGSKPALNDKGAPRVGVTVAETDLVYVSDNAGTFEVNTVLNVKASGEKGMAASARQQNVNFESVLRGKPGDLVKIKDGATVRFARVKRITALDGAALLDLTGRLRPGASMTLESVGTHDAGGFTKTLSETQGVVKDVAELLEERQLIEGGLY